MKTPGGGGYGIKCEGNEDIKKNSNISNVHFLERGSVFEYRQSQESV